MKKPPHCKMKGDERENAMSCTGNRVGIAGGKRETRQSGRTAWFGTLDASWGTNNGDGGGQGHALWVNSKVKRNRKEGDIGAGNRILTRKRGVSNVP